MKLHCDKCGKTWTDGINPVDGVWTVFQNIMESHRKQSPDCDGDRYDIKLLES